MRSRVMLSLLLPVLLSSLGSFGLTQENDVKIDWSFFNCHLQLYEPCPSSKIFFYLFTNKSDLPYRLDSSDPRLPTAVNSSLPLKVIIHGYAGRVLTDPTSQIRTEYQRTGGVNVLVVDWGRLAKLPCYPTAVLNTAQVGQCTAEFLAALVRRPGARPKYVHIIGFSLGAHIASFVSNYVHMATGRKIYRITGLDPALPLFANLKTSYKLDKKDARHVDIIHTNIGVFGKREPIGHVDFYVNEGSMQPSCHNHRNPSLCSHMLAPTYFAESISSPKGFWGTSCPSYLQYAWGWCPLLESGQPQARQRIQMGEHILKGARGVYIVKTALNPPYALG